MLAAAARGGENARRLTAFSAGIGVAGVAVHFKAWPWSLHRGLPMLDEAEGLSEDQLPAYNAVLWFWLVCSALSLPAANRPGARRFALAGLLNFPILLASARAPLPLGPRAGRARAGALEPGAARIAADGPESRHIAGSECPSAAALSLTFDNLGEAAELEMGALAAEAPLGDHLTALEVLPALLGQLGERGIAATFFVEGLNAELYPDLLREIDARGHEVAYHAWRHEQWADLSAAEQAENLAPRHRRVRAARPRDSPACARRAASSARAARVLREAGLRYCSPAGAGAGVEDGVALLPFQWRHLDASCVLPPLAPAREQMTGSPDPVEPAAFVASLEAEIERLARTAATWRSSCTRSCSTGSATSTSRRCSTASRWPRREGRSGSRPAPTSPTTCSPHPERFGNGTVLDSSQLDRSIRVMSALGDVAAAILPPEAGGPDPERRRQRRQADGLAHAGSSRRLGSAAGLVGLEALFAGPHRRRLGAASGQSVGRAAARGRPPRRRPRCSTRSSRSSCSPTAPTRSRRRSRRSAHATSPRVPTRRWRS